MMPPDDEAVVAADIAAVTAQVAADDAARAAEAVAEADTKIDPVIVAAEVEMQRQEEETARARIEANSAVKIAEIQAEAPQWQTELISRIEALEMAITALTVSQASTPPTTAATVVVEPTAPTVVENSGGDGGALPAAETSEPMPVVEPENVSSDPPAPAPARRQRWI